MQIRPFGLRSLTVTVLVLLSCSSAAFAGSQKGRSVWVPAPTGSLIGSGSYRQVNSDRTPENADEALSDAIATLNSRGRMSGGEVVVLPAVAQQTGVPSKTLRAQQSATKMLYGDILVANVLAKAAGKTFEEVIALRVKKKNWSEVARDLRVTVSSVALVARKADQTADLAASGGARSRNQTGEQKIQDLGVSKSGMRPGG